jgi:hypothetical protein
VSAGSFSMTVPAPFASPRRCEASSDTIRVRGPIRESEYGVKPPHLNLLPAGGAKEFAAHRAILPA